VYFVFCILNFIQQAKEAPIPMAQEMKALTQKKFIFMVKNNS
jgi:hypothetical protein